MTPSDFDLAKIADIRQRLGQLNAWIDTIRGRNGWASFRPEDKPASVPDVSNDERGLLEKFDWVNVRPIDILPTYKADRSQRGTARFSAQLCLVESTETTSADVEFQSV